MVPGSALAILAAIGADWGVHGATWAYACAAALTALAAYLLWKKATLGLDTQAGSFATPTLLRSSLPLFWVSSMTSIMGWTGTFLLGVWGTSADVGIYTAAARTALLTSLILIAVNSIAAPKFAALYRQGDFDALSSTARHSTLLMALLATPILLVFLAFPRLVLGLFGTEFQAGGPILSILALGQFVNVATGSVGYLLMMSGHERSVRNNMVFAAALNIGLSCVLIPLFGRIGAAVATAVAIATLNLGAAYLVWSRLGIVTIPFGPPSRVRAKHGPEI
jgi:O-antigen/teichoic acid export membrane protein